MDFVSKNLNFGKNNFDAISPSMKTQSTSDLQKIELNPQNDYKRYTVMSIYRQHILRYIAGFPSSPVTCKGDIFTETNVYTREIGYLTDSK